jgi:hypothetical protein
MASEIYRVELKHAIQRAVVARIAAWDAERDIEILLGGDVDALAEIINDASAVGSAAMTDEQLERVAEEIIEAHAEQYSH